MLLSVGLRILSSSTCVGLRYGYSKNNSGFSRRMAHILPYLKFGPHHVFPLPGGFACQTGTPLARGFPFRAYAFTRVPQFCLTAVQESQPVVHRLRLSPRLRSRLTQGRSALPWKPWIFGREDSHLTLATHSGILSSIKSTAPSGTASSLMQCSSTNPLGFRGFGGVFQPRTFSAQDLSTSELLRTLECMAASKPTSWLSSKSHILFHLTRTWGP